MPNSPPLEANPAKGWLEGPPKMLVPLLAPPKGALGCPKAPSELNGLAGYKPPELNAG